MYIYTYIHIYIYMCVCVCIHTHTDLFTSGGPKNVAVPMTVVCPTVTWNCFSVLLCLYSNTLL